MVMRASKLWMASWRAFAGAASAKETEASRRKAIAARRRLSISAELLRCTGLKTDFGNFAFRRRLDFEKFAGFEIEHAGDDVGRKLHNLGIEIADDGVVVAARVLDAVFELVQRGAQLRIGFGEGEDLAQSGGEHVFGAGFRGGPLRGHGRVARLHDAFDRAALVGGVTFNGFDEIGNQIVAALELDINVGPGVVALHFELDQAVVHPDGDKNQDDNDCQYYPTEHRIASLLILTRGRAVLFQAAWMPKGRRKHTWGARKCKARRRLSARSRAFIWRIR